MKANPIVSVVITSYNQKSELAEAIESVLAQSRQPSEVLVCDDASSDGSRELIRSYEQRGDSVVRGICHELNVGVSKNRSAGLRAASGDFVTWLDGDDIFLPRKLEVEIDRLMEVRSGRWAYSQVRVRDLQKGVIHNRYTNAVEGDIFEAVAGMVGFAPKSPLVERALLEEVGYLDPQLELYEDFDLILRLAARSPVVFTSETGMEYRKHGAGLHTKEQERHLESLAYIDKKLARLAAERGPKAAEAMVERFRERVYVMTNTAIQSRRFGWLDRFISGKRKNGKR